MLDLGKLQAQLGADDDFDWVAGETSVSNLFEAANTNLFGLNYDDSSIKKVAVKKGLFESLHLAFDYDPKFDWRNYKGRDWTTNIKDQRRCGACVAFAVSAVWESQLKIEDFNHYQNIDLSEAFLFFCSGQECSKGWRFEDALDFSQKTGTVDENCFPYTGMQSGCKACSDWSSRITKIRSWNSTTDSRQKKYLISTHGPLVAGMDVYEDFGFYKSGIYKHITGVCKGKHAIAIVGYDDDLGCWICKNSWGTGWGERGWFRIAYKDCNIDFYPAFNIDI